VAPPLGAAGWVPLFSGKNLDGWEIIGSIRNPGSIRAGMTSTNSTCDWSTGHEPPVTAASLFAPEVPGQVADHNRFPDSHPSGSAVTLNGQLVAEHAGDPQRPKAGPIGLQLHDQFSIIMFRNVRIREIGR
jgi:hypothetical protein